MPAYRGTMGTPGTAGGADTTIAFTAGAAAAGRRAVVGVSYYDAADGGVSLAGAGGGWTLDKLAHPVDTPNHDAIFSKHLASDFAGGVITATFANASGYRGICGCYLVGVDPADPVDVTGSGGAGALGGWAAPITTTVNGTVIVAFGHNPFGAGASTPAATWNLVESFNNVADVAGMAMVYGFGPTAGAWLPQVSAGNNGQGVSVAYQSPPDVPGDEDTLIRLAGKHKQSDEKTYVGGLWV